MPTVKAPRTRGRQASVEGKWHDAGFWRVKFTIVNPDVWQHWMNLTPLFSEYYIQLFRNCVFESHKYLIRVTPVDTGRLRAGWTSILKKYQIDYQMAFLDLSLVDSPALNPLDPSMIAIGEKESVSVDLPLAIAVENNVPYAAYMEYGTSVMAGRHFTNRARYKAELILKNAFEDWLKEMVNVGDVVPPKPVKEMAV